MLEQAIQAVRFARNVTDDVEFSPEDGYRSDPDFLARVIEAVIKEGATHHQHPGHRGLRHPELYGNFIKTLRERVPNSDQAIWSVHCHNDLGMAVANSLAGVKIGGARQIECTINGLGERAGNCSLEEVVMAVKTRRDYFGLDCNIDASATSLPPRAWFRRPLAFVVQPNKAVVGANAFAHASGIHQDGVLKARDTYEIMRAEDVGWSANKIVLGKLSGRNAFKQRLQELGIALESEAEVNAAFVRFKDLADRKNEIFDEDIIALVMDESVSFGPGALPPGGACRSAPRWASSRTPVWCLRSARKSIGPRADGNGPVDAVLRAIESTGPKWRRDAALFGQCHHQRQHRIARRGDGALAACRSRGQWRGGRSRYRGRLGQGIFERAEQAAKQDRAGRGAGLIGRTRPAAPGPFGGFASWLEKAVLTAFSSFKSRR